MNSEKDFVEIIDLFEHLYESNPLVFTSQFAPFKFISNRALILNEKIDLKLEHQLRFASLYLPSTYSPTFFLPEIYNNQRESFSEINTAVLYNFIDQAIFRIGQDHFVFEHLHASFSKIHTNFKPFTEMTFKIFKKITTDLSKSKDIEKMQILTKIYSNE